MMELLPLFTYLERVDAIKTSISKKVKNTPSNAELFDLEEEYK